MSDFFSVQFSVSNSIGQIIWALIFLLCGRAMTWVFHGSFGNKAKEIVFWIVGFISILLVLSLITSSPMTGPYTKEPKLRGDIDQVLIGQSRDEKKEPGIILIVSVRNVGAPTAVEGWSLSVTPLGGASFVMEHMAIPETLTIFSDKGEDTVILYGQNALYNKTLSPIPTGGMQRGILWYRFPQGIDKDMLTRTGTKFAVFCSDILGKQYTIEGTWKGKTNPIRYSPGLLMSIAPPQ